MSLPEIKPIIVSHRRAGSVQTHKHVSNCTICIPESQAEEYKKAHPDLPQLVHPDSVVGLWAKRDWVRQNAGDHMQLDDDMIGMYRIYRPLGGWKKSVVSRDVAYELIQATGDRARKIGAYLFGFGQHCNPLTYNGLKPFRFGGYTPGGATGLLEGARLHWPTDVMLGDGDDYWICLLNYHMHRYAFFDRRFACAFVDTYTSPGGLSEYRSTKHDTSREDVEWEVIRFLQAHFGRELVRRNFAGPNAATKYIKNPGRRQIHLPYIA